ncbi:MAG: hypothetical protein JNK11_00025 [Alphaproteobacteria bacterium]|nr:hypothetical protein [Alphaproteobacteria bacterium]
MLKRVALAAALLMPTQACNNDDLYMASVIGDAAVLGVTLVVGGIMALAKDSSPPGSVRCQWSNGEVEYGVRREACVAPKGQVI